MLKEARFDNNLPFGNEEDGLEFKLTFNREVLNSKVVFPVIRQAFVKCTILLGLDVLGIARPDRLCLVEFFVRGLHFLDLLLLLVLWLVRVILNLLDLGFPVLVRRLGGLGLLLLFFVIDFLQMTVEVEHSTNGSTDLLNLLRHSKLDWIGNELGVFLDDFFDLFLLEVFELILLEEQTDLCATAERIRVVGGDRKSTASGGLPDILLVIIVFRDHLDAFRDEVSGVETDTELTDHRYIGAGAQRLHEALQRADLSKPGCKRTVTRTFVPDLAIVPRLFTMSAFVIPIPVSRISKHLLSLSGVMRMYNSFSVSRTDGLVSDS
jgi:hypothetical protein